MKDIKKNLIFIHTFIHDVLEQFKIPGTEHKKIRVYDCKKRRKKVNKHTNKLIYTYIHIYKK